MLQSLDGTQPRRHWHSESKKYGMLLLLQPIRATPAGRVNVLFNGCTSEWMSISLGAYAPRRMDLLRHQHQQLRNNNSNNREHLEEPKICERTRGNKTPPHLRNSAASHKISSQQLRDIRILAAARSNRSFIRQLSLACPPAATLSSCSKMLTSARRGLVLTRTMASSSSSPLTRAATAQFHSEVRKTDLICTQGFVNGKWVDAHADKHFSVIDPATDQEIARIADMSASDTHAAIQAALEAQRKWKKTTPVVRSNLLKKWHAAILEHTDDLAVIASAESGKPLLEAKGEVAYAAGFIDYYAHEIMHSAGFVVPPSTTGQQIIAVKEPVGVCGIITPWNFPLAMITRKLGPCLAAGCTAVVKPAAETPLSALALAKLAQEVGIPSGVINVVTSAHGNAAEIGEALSTSNDVRKISFTGSTRVGKILMQQSASNVKRLSLELGGNAPFIVFEDADVDAAVDGLMASKFRNTGQTCVCSNRVFIHEAIYEEFSKKFVARVQQLKMGRPRDSGTQLGPLIGPAAFQKTSELVEDAVSKGAKALTGGKPSSQGKNFYEATLLTGVNNSMRVWHEEIFGPVVPIFKFSTEEEVIESANCTDAGLAGYFYTQNLKRVWRVAAALECGMIGVNTGIISNVQAPFGGVKQSGLGREGSPLGLDEYTETKLVCMGGLE